MTENTIRWRLLTSLRPLNGRIEAVRMLEGEDGHYTIHVRLSWKQGEYLVAQWASDKPKRTTLQLSVRECRDKLDFFGPIILETSKKEPEPP